VSDALILASKADALLLLLDRQHTSHQAAHRACEVIKSVGAVLIGTVLTKARVRARDSAYYYYAARARRGRGKTPAWIIRLKRLFSFRRLRRRVKLGSTSRRPEGENVELGV